MSQKVAYVTGGMGGIGTAICQRLHKEGFKVIAGCGPTRDHAKWLAEQKALGYTFHASVGNVGDWDSTVEAFGKTKAEHGTIDVLVNNAGITKDGLMMRMTEAQWDAVLNVNLKSAFNFIHAVVPVMARQRSGSIINMSSVVGVSGNPRGPDAQDGQQRQYKILKEDLPHQFTASGAKRLTHTDLRHTATHA